MSYYHPNDYAHNPHWVAMRRHILRGEAQKNFRNYDTGSRAALSPGYATENPAYAAQLNRSNDTQMYNVGTSQTLTGAQLHEFNECADYVNYPQGCAVLMGIAPSVENMWSMKYRHSW
jgi:hypothetical protein